MKKNKKSPKFFIIYLILYMAVLPLFLFLFKSYYRFQASIFLDDNTLMFVNNSIAQYVIAFAPGIIILCIMLRITNNNSTRIMKIKFWTFIAILTFIISTFILICQFFEYSNIKNDGIFVRNGLFFSERTYMWSDVTYAEVSYESGNKGQIDIIYDIHLDDGTKIKLRNASDFFDKIVNLDNFIKDKKIKINRSTIQPNDYAKIEHTYNQDKKGGDISDTMKVILQILNK
ncbi:hypothetical protein [Clostridium beijerinckii]|uniref:hypothetical protein n=1 Tax=Clostridium beijerinckii TaxID=1520 RepID=UPI00156F2E8B|nr:hypothetical protein [Clostridium beijerinckii]NRT73822.1 hypothetical protein [Clostridium beijerinckii]